MTINNYTRGTQVQLKVTFSVNSVATDPSSVTFRVTDPLGNETDYTGGAVIRDSAGVYHILVMLNTCGTWWYRVEGTGVATAAEENQLVVRPSNF